MTHPHMVEVDVDVGESSLGRNIQGAMAISV